MNHYALLCVTDTDNTDELRACMAPFDNKLEVAPYIQRGVLGWLAMRQALATDNDILTWVRQRFGRDAASYGVDEHGLYHISTTNPQGRWSTWRVGGPLTFNIVGVDGKGGNRMSVGDIDWGTTFAAGAPHAVLLDSTWHDPARSGTCGATEAAIAAHQHWCAQTLPRLDPHRVVWALSAQI